MSLSKKILSMIMVAHHPNMVKEFLENIEQTVDNPDCIELLIQIDDDSLMRAMLDEAVQTYSFDIRYIQNVLQMSFQPLFNIANPNTYFFQVVNEGLRFKMRGWDTILKKYIHFFQDDIFRLKIAEHQYRNYYGFQECGPAANKYFYLTRKWLELSGGVGESADYDCWHQYVDYHLGQTKGIDGIPGLFRSIPVSEVVVEENSVNSRSISQEWSQFNSVKSQQTFRRIATKMLACIWAHNENIKDYSVKENTFFRWFSIRENKKNKIKKIFFYSVSSLYIRFQNFLFLLKTRKAKKAMK